MIIELQIFKYRIVLTAAKIEVIEGIYSLLDNDKHFLMWDFDDVCFDDVRNSLKMIQYSFLLPRIHILETMKDKGYHAYCLCRVTFKDACAILGMTEHIDMRYYTAGVTRHKWTLRLSEKSGRNIQPIDVLETIHPENVTIDDIKNGCFYKTPGDGHKTKIIKMGGV